VGRGEAPGERRARPGGRRFGVLSIRARLAILGTGTVLLVTGLLSTLVIQDLRAQRASSVQRLLNLAEATAANVGTVLGTSRAAAERLAEGADRVLAGAPGGCAGWLARNRETLPLFSNLVLVDRTGAPVCSQVGGVVGVVDYADRAWLAEALEGRPSMEGPMIGRRFPVWSVALSAPVRDSTGLPVGVVTVGLELARFQDFMGSLSLPRGSILTVSRNDGVIVARSQDPERWIGKEFPPPMATPPGAGTGAYTTEGPSLEGEPMLFANVPVPGAPWRVDAGWSEREALGPAFTAARGSLVLAIGLILVTSVGLTWVYVPVTRSLSGLVDGTQGALLDRRPLRAEGPAEVRSVATRFNEALLALSREEDQGRRLARVIAQLPDPVFITDREGVIEYVNPAFERVTGYTASEAIGRTPRLLRSEEHTPEVYSEMWRTIKAGFTYRGRFRNRRKNGELYTEEKTIGPLRSESGEITHFVSTGKDVTEAEAISERLSQAEKLEAIGQMAGGVAHDFNNLLTAISGYAELLSTEIEEGPGPESAEHVRKILEGAHMGGALTRQLLGITTRQTVHSEPVNLNHVVERLTAFLRRVIPADIEVVRALDPEVGPVWLDPVQAEQMVLNLALNARDAMPDGGRLKISTHAADGDSRQIRFEVSDTGLGIPPEVLPRIFDPFFTTKSHGTGLGLVTVAEIVRSAHGRVDVESEPGRGTTFRIRLPEGHVYTVPPLGEGSEAGDSGAGTRCTILLAEDDPRVRALLTRVLEQAGHEVLVAPDGRAALERARSWEGPLHLVVSDVMMPEMKGPDLVAAVRSDRPGLPAVLISGHANVSLEAGFANGPTELISKPVSPAALREAVSRLAGGRPGDP